MVSPNAPVVERMQSLVRQWEETANPQAVFLRCYQMMTGNMLAAIEHDEFQDPVWVAQLIEHFAEYYFVALEAYERDPATAPRVWQQAHDTTRDPQALPIQNLLLGVNAHINYDLALTLVDLLKPEWGRLAEERRAGRYTDYSHVNDVIARTIDAVQDQVLEPAMPSMDLVDQLLGSVDEFLVSRLITNWRENVWHMACLLLEADSADEQLTLRQRLEQGALELGQVIRLRDFGTIFDRLSRRAD